MGKSYIPREEWEGIARRLPIGRSIRVQHGREHRQNMVVRNLPDRFTAYCHACQMSGVVFKEHAVLAPQPEPEFLVAPTDLIPVRDSGMALRFLAQKHIPLLPEYLNPLAFSPSANRIIVVTPEGTLGRTIGNSSAKWMTYDKQTFATLRKVSNPLGAVVVEDALSAHKLAVVCAAEDVHINVYAALGSDVSAALLVHLLSNEIPQVWVWPDGDAAGNKFRERWLKKHSALGITGGGFIPTEGRDPKDYTIDEIRVVLSTIGGTAWKL